MKRLSFFIFILFIQSSFAQEIDYKGLPQWSWHKEDSTEYFLYTPSNLQAGKKYPVVLAMHGCCGENYRATLRNTVDPIVRMWHNFGANTQQVPTYIIAPATSRGWTQHFKNLKKVMDDLIANHNGDSQRIYVTGFSMGGDGTFRIIQQYPNYFAAAITMGMSFRGDSAKVKNIPLWSNQGETDYYARSLKKNIADIRHLNGNANDTGATWVTGVNPRYSNFKGIGHVVMWPAASMQNLTGWAYSKINDGNIYPVIFFEEPSYKQITNTGENSKVHINAHDPDGTIAKVELYQNDKLVKTLISQPFQATITAQEGDNFLKTIAYDNKSKTSEANTILKVNVHPAFIASKLPKATAGVLYEFKIEGKCNGNFTYTLNKSSTLPQGILFYPDGLIKGVPIKNGNYILDITLKDEDGDEENKSYTLTVNSKDKNTVLVNNVVTKEGTAYRTSVIKIGESPNFNSKDSVLSDDLPEINFNDVGKYKGLTFIQTDANDANKSDENFLSFDIDENAIVYIAYETLDSNFHSTMPAWLKTFKKEDGQISAQYRYFNIYSKIYPKGKVVLPAADAKANNVSTNYFIILKRQN